MIRREWVLGGDNEEYMGKYEDGLKYTSLGGGALPASMRLGCQLSRNSSSPPSKPCLSQRSAVEFWRGRPLRKERRYLGKANISSGIDEWRLARTSVRAERTKRQVEVESIVRRQTRRLNVRLRSSDSERSAKRCRRTQTK